MSLTILITGFGPFPGAPFNPTGALVELLARQSPVQAGTRRVAHVFATSYGTVDRELPALIARERPAALVMFGLAQRTRHVRIETLARNTLSRTHADVAGILPTANAIVADAPAALALPAPHSACLPPRAPLAHGPRATPAAISATICAGARAKARQAQAGRRS
jgi:pyroglutamyl-peptidase